MLRACGKPSIGFCQYCGSHFCESHGEQIDDHQQVCFRKPCVAKKEDLAQHTIYREAVRIRNLTRQCGIEGCDGGIEIQCFPCRGYYCERHTEVRHAEAPQGGEAGTHFFCEHCWRRRPIWMKR
jgi:hypothetical protein